METPRLEIHTDRIAHNASAVTSQCGAQGIRVAAVTKVTQAHPALLRALEGSGCVMLADSRIDNLKWTAKAGLGLPTMLLWAPTPGNAPEAVRQADHTPIPSYQIAETPSSAAEMAGVRHKVVMMVDVGDLREGVWPGWAAEEASRIARLPYLEVTGLGTNLAYFGGVIPTYEKMEILVTLRDERRSATGHPPELVSGGNSANLPLLASGEMPAGINNLRIGEAIILGRNVLDRSPWPGTWQDTVELIGGIVELQRKPSVPIGRTGQGTFGDTTHFTDRGLRLRAICDLGHQGAAPDAIEPVDLDIEVLDASSDHLIIDVTNAETPAKVGSEIRFLSSYGGLLSANTSPHTRKTATGKPWTTSPPGTGSARVVDETSTQNEGVPR